MPNKAIAGTIATTIPGAITWLIVYIWWKDAPAEGVVAVMTLVQAIVTFVSVYLTRMEPKP